MYTHTVKSQDIITGVWVSHKNGDVHNYICLDGSLVIGWNKTYKDKIDFSDLALVAEPKAKKPRLQYVGSDGEPKTVDVTPETWANAILAMLEGLKAKAVNLEQEKNEI